MATGEADVARSAFDVILDAGRCRGNACLMPYLLRPPPLLGRQSFSLTALVSLAGLPALALPVTAAAGVVASIPVIGPTEERVLAFGRVIETALRA